MGKPEEDQEVEGAEEAEEAKVAEEVVRVLTR